MKKSGLEFRINGRKVSQRQFVKNIETQAVRLAEKEIERKVGSVRDPETGAPLKIRSKERRTDKIAYDVEGSPEAIEKLKKAFR